MFFDAGMLYRAELKLESDMKIYGDVIPKGSTLILDGEGRVAGIRLSKLTTIRGIQCDWGSSSVSGDIEFDKNGKISMVKLAREQVVRNKKLPGGTTIYFDEDGTMRLVQ